MSALRGSRHLARTYLAVTRSRLQRLGCARGARVHSPLEATARSCQAPLGVGSHSLSAVTARLLSPRDARSARSASRRATEPPPACPLSRGLLPCLSERASLLLAQAARAVLMRRGRALDAISLCSCRPARLRLLSATVSPPRRASCASSPSSLSRSAGLGWALAVLAVCSWPPAPRRGGAAPLYASRGVEECFGGTCQAGRCWDGTRNAL
jgi:hypothetical protein